MWSELFWVRDSANLQIRHIVLLILHRTVSRCLSKSNRVSRMIPRCFWNVACITLLLNTSGACDIVLDFQLKMTSCALFVCFVLIRVKTRFPRKDWKAQFVFGKSLSSSRAELLLSWITGTKEVFLSANSFSIWRQSFR